MSAPLELLAGCSRLDEHSGVWDELGRSMAVLSWDGSSPHFQTHLGRLLETNPSTGNILLLFQKSSEKLRSLSSQPTTNARRECCILLHLVGLVLAYLAANLPAPHIRRQLLLSSDWPRVTYVTSYSGTGALTVQTLIDEVISALSRYPSVSWDHDVALCSCNVLLCAFSTQLYELNASPDNLFMSYVYNVGETQLRYALQHGDKDVSSTMPARLVRGLLLRAIVENTAPKDSIWSGVLVQKPSKGLSPPGRVTKAVKDNTVGSAVRDILEIFISFFGFPIPTEDEAGKNNKIQSKSGISKSNSGTRLQSTTSSHLGERSKNLLLILLCNRRSSTLPNAFRECLSLLRDDKLEDGEAGAEGAEFDLETHGNSGAKVSMTLQRRIHIDLSYVSKSLGGSLPSEGSVLLLYSIMQAHPNFVEMLLRGGNVEPILTGVLHGMYGIVENSFTLDHLYLLVVCVLMLVQDASLRASLVSSKPKAPWYRERVLSDSNMSDLVVLCTLRMALYGTYSLRDKYITSNCFAILLNMAPVIENINVYTAERLVKITIQLSKRVVRDSEEKVETEIDTGRAASADVLEFLCCLLKVMGILLRPSRRNSNVQLIYALVAEHEKVCDLFSHPTVIRCGVDGASDSYTENSLASLDELSALVQLGYAALEGDNGDQAELYSANRAVEVLSAAIAEHASGKKTTDTEPPFLSYNYVETDNPEAFFVPLAWTNAVRISSEFDWFGSSIALFDAVGQNQDGGGDQMV